MATIRGTDQVGEQLHGTNAADIMFGMGKADWLYAFGGNDVLKGGGGADHLFGGEGKDTADYSDSNTGVQVSIAAHGGSFGTAEGDKLYEIENLNGSQHDDILEGDKNANVLYGDSGNDVLKGGGGADTLQGGNGNDQLNSDGVADKLDGGAGIDTAFFQGASVPVHVNLGTGYFNAGYHHKPVVQGTPENIVNIEHVKGTNSGDTIFGSTANNNLYGYDGHDRLYGGAGKDAINGGLGNDTINGGAGNDTLIGGLGNDIFVFDGDVSGAADMGKDTVKGFKPSEDHIQFDDAIFDSFADVKAHMTEVNGSAVITVDADTTITILNVKMSSLGAGDFLFS